MQLEAKQAEYAQFELKKNVGPKCIAFISESLKESSDKINVKGTEFVYV